MNKSIRQYECNYIIHVRSAPVLIGISGRHTEIESDNRVAIAVTCRMYENERERQTKKRQIIFVGDLSLKVSQRGKEREKQKKLPKELYLRINAYWIFVITETRVGPNILYLNYPVCFHRISMYKVASDNR